MSSVAPLKNKVISGMVWSSIGQFSSLAVTLISNIVLARLLTPDDYGAIGMLAIFLSISLAFVNGGFTMALIQKKNIKEIDYTTIFWWNLIVAVFFVCLLFFLAPAIANFYRLPILKNILRVQSLDLIICSLQLVPISKFKREIKFKPLATRRIIASIVATISAIIMAYSGFGVWTLVFCTLIKSSVNTTLLWTLSDWRPSFRFSFASWKELFNFGGLMLGASLIDALYTNISGLIIGRAFSAKDMGYYAQARKLEEVPSNVMSAVINEVSFSAFSRIQDESERLIKGLRNNIHSVAFLCFGMMSLLLSIASPLFTLLFTSKWNQSVPYFQILCLASMFYTLNNVNSSAIKSIGKSNVYFNIHLVQQIIGLILIISGVKFGIIGMLWGMLLSTLITFIMNAFVNQKYIGYKVWLQLKDVGGYYFLSLTISALSLYIESLLVSWNYVFVMLLQMTLFIVLYLTLCYMLKMPGIIVFMKSSHELITRRKNK